ncbi:MAG: penicillin-binding protein 1C [Burkholderiales bacterium]|nr:penicillin-binding protein 1C [Burkholderiales bacterium]
MRFARGIVVLSFVAGAAAAQALPTFAEVKAAHRPSDITLLDRHGAPIQTLRVDKSVRRLPWVPLAEMSPALLQAIVLSEDRRFYEHSGVDWSAVARSAWGNLWNRKTRGASTLTMQLAGLIDDGLARPAAGRSVAQKIGQALTATQLETRWKKSEVLEAYLNSVPFRGEIVGIDALAQTLFGKHASGLDAQEAALAAALVRGPNAPAATVAQRACGVLQLQSASCTGVVALTETALARRGGMPLGEQLAPHFARQVIATDGAATQRSTLDAGLQRIAIGALRRQLAELSGRNVEDGALVVLDNTSGEVLAWVGSSGDFSGAAQVDGVLARRQPGSTLKPFVYELAFEKKLITPASLLDDSAAQIETAGGLYLPQNYDGDFKGWVSARTALGASLNVPAVRVGAMLGPDALVQRLNAFGLALPQPGGYYGNALALGGADVTLLALTNAYRALANGGAFTPAVLRAASAPTAPSRVADAAAVYLVANILADNNARVRTFGQTSQLATRGFAAVKTGTSKDLRDNWCIGFTDRYTVGVWVGNASGAAMHDVSGISGAAPVWRALVEHLHRGRPSSWPRVPAGVVTEQVVFDAAREPPREEYFIRGTEQGRQTAGTQMANARRYGITSPRDGSIFAIDPDIPPAAQRIRFEGEHGVWVLDGKRLGSATEWSWAPWPGRHELTLLAHDGRALQTVRFEVRGAEARKARAGTR